MRREFTATGPDEIWCADITYIPTGAGFLYLAAVIDLWSRRVVGWSMRNDLSTPLVTDAVDMAIGQRKPDRVIHHSDRGSQYSSKAFKARCERAGIELSTGRRGDAYDNAVAESFFATLETELLDRTGFATREPGPNSRLRFHRRVLQHPETALHHRIPITRRLRKEPPS